MFLAIGFIFQTRLDFDTSVRQFFIVLFGTAAVIIVLVFKFDELKKEVRKLAIAGPKVKELEEKKPAEKKTTKRK